MTPDDQRPNPDAILAGLQREELQSKSGKLFIFLGMCPGVGKTYAMLHAARQRQTEGVTVVAGLVETHGRPETASLLEGLEVLPRKKLEHRSFTLEEFDIDEALRRRPELLLVDELAHTNAPGSRHAKRYQDVLELIEAGIDVYTTLNVQHIESQVDIVHQISGVGIHETVPDSILDRAHEIQLIDLSVEQLLERMAEGKVYMGERAATAVENFFREGNLTALREMALRFTAERVDRDLEDIRRAKRVSSPWKTNARLMVGVGPSPYSESLIRWTRRAAARLGCPWLVVWVEGSRDLTAAEQERLTLALALARKLGAEVVSVTGDDVAGALLRIARERNVTQIVVGKPGRRSFFRRALSDKVIDASGEIDVCVVRPQLAAAGGKTVRGAPAPPVSDSLVAEYSIALMVTFALVALGRGAFPYMGYVPVGLVFLLAVTLAGLKFRRGPVMVMAAVSALSWNFFFIEPLYTFNIGKLEDIIMFGMFFIVALSMGHLTTRLREREQAERRRQKLTAALLRVTQSAALSAEPKNGVAEALRTINELLGADTALVARNPDRSLPGTVHGASTFTPPAKEWGVLNWSYQNKQPAGRFTDTLPQSAATWFPLQTSTAVMGVFGVKLRSDSMDFGVRQAIEAFALQLALVFEKEHFIHAINQVELLAHSERLQRTLLDSVSHELKTPLAVIQVALEALADQKNPYLDEIQTASKRLQRVVNNLLQMTRIEASAVQPAKEWCLPGDLVHQTCETAGDASARHPLSVHIPADLPPVSLDPGLFVQAAANILHNADTYAPEGTSIEISCAIDSGNTLTLRIADRGPGLPQMQNAEEQVFQKFYRGPGSPTGGTGLGLSIARALIRSLGGNVTARNRPGGGAEFVITVPVETLAA